MTPDPILLLEDGTGANATFRASLNRMEHAAKINGIEVAKTHRDRIGRFTVFPKIAENRPCFVYGSIQFCRDLKPMEGQYPFVYGGDPSWIKMTAHVPRKLLLNHDFLMTSWADFVNEFDHWRQHFASDDSEASLFVRPSASNKIFAGDLVFDKIDIMSIDTASAVTNETLCVVASEKDFTQEERYFIGNSEIISGTPVNEIGKPKLQHLITPEILGRWSPDTMYTLDVCLDANGQLKIVEYNGFSTAGVYFADVEKILTYAVNQTILDFKETTEV